MMCYHLVAITLYHQIVALSTLPNGSMIKSYIENTKEILYKCTKELEIFEKITI